MKLQVADWKYSKTWVYSITYDEGLVDLWEYVIPAHMEFGIPGHVEVVVGHLGVIRQLFTSSYNGMWHMSVEQLKELTALGWGVGSHSWQHGLVMDDPELELKKSREVLSEAMGYEITVYTAPGSNANLTSEIEQRIWEYGYLAGFSITDDINRPDDSLLFGNRVAIHERYPGYFENAFDAFKRITQAKREKGWIVDYCHCPLEKAVDDYKDCSAAHHRERLEAVVTEGAHDCWFADPDRVVDYRYMRKHCKITETAGVEGAFTIDLESLPAGVRCRDLTFEIATFLTPELLEVSIDGKVCPLVPLRAGVLSFTAAVNHGSAIHVKPTITAGSTK